MRAARFFASGGGALRGGCSMPSRRARARHALFARLTRRASATLRQACGRKQTAAAYGLKDPARLRIRRRRRMRNPGNGYCTCPVAGGGPKGPAAPGGAFLIAMAREIRYWRIAAVSSGLSSAANEPMPLSARCPSSTTLLKPS
jgi:hypothetical protein